MAGVTFPVAILPFFKQLRIWDKQGVKHEGKQPSLLEKPFKKVEVQVPKIGPVGPMRVPENSSIVGYGACVNCSMQSDATKQRLRWKVETLLEDGRVWNTYITPNGNITGSWI